jgi:hypothetical protein
MATIEKPQGDFLGRAGESCSECGAPLATDQRYCLNCGRRRTGPRLDFREYMRTSEAPIGDGSGPDGPPPAAAAVPARDWTPIWGIAALAALGIMFVIGVLIGKDDAGTVASQPSVIRLGEEGVAASPNDATQKTAAATSFKSDWPAGKTGWTVELGTLPKGSSSGADVEAAKQDVESKGATDVGALDTDQYASLPPGNYLIYSGVYDTKADASKALKKLKGDFPDAKVVKVSDKGAAAAAEGPIVDDLTSAEARGAKGPVTASDQALQELQNASPEEYQQATQKLPNEIKIPGKPPPPDNQAPGAGGDPIVIGGG